MRHDVHDAQLPLPLQAAAPAGALVAVDGRTYPLRAVDLIARTDGGCAISTLVQSFENPYDEALEVAYTLPLPADGAVLGFTIQLGDRTLRGEIEKLEKARTRHRQAIREGRTSGLLEQQRVNTFSQSLGNVPARTRVEVRVEVLHPLTFQAAAPGSEASSTWEYRFPTVVGVRYHGAEGRVPDATALSPDRAANGTPVKAKLALTIGDGQHVTGLASSSHKLVAGPEGTIGFDEASALDRDVVVRWDAGVEHVGCTLVEGGGLPGDDGRYGLVTIVPPRRPETVHARELTLLLDASGSMGGDRIELAKRLVRGLIEGLDERDRFELLTFSSGQTRLTPGSDYVQATPAAVGESLRRLEGVYASGGTEMDSALRAAFERASGDAQRQVVLVTDGDVSFESEVVARVAATRNVRLHCVGVGAVPNRALLREAAWAGRGVEVLIGDECDLVRASERLRRATGLPVLTQLEVGGSAVAAGPKGGLHDVFGEQPLTVAIELSPKGGEVVLKGRLAGTTEPWAHVFRVPPASEVAAESRTTLPVGAVFGRETVGALEVQAAAHGGRSREPFQDDIETVALRHRIVSSRTSLVAISENLTVDPKDPTRRVRIAVEVPSDVSAEAVGLTRVAKASHRSALATLCSTRISEDFPPTRQLRGKYFDNVNRLPIELKPMTIEWVGKRDLMVELEVTQEVRDRFPLDTWLDQRWTPSWSIHQVLFLPESGQGTPMWPLPAHALTGRLVETASTRLDAHPVGVVVRLVFRFGRELDGLALPANGWLEWGPFLLSTLLPARGKA